MIIRPQGDGIWYETALTMTMMKMKMMRNLMTMMKIKRMRNLLRMMKIKRMKALLMKTLKRSHKGPQLKKESNR